MSGICIIPLLHDYNVKEVKLHTFRIKHKDNIQKEMFVVEKSDGTTIKILFNAVLSFITMSKRLELQNH